MQISKKDVALWDYTEVTLEAEYEGKPFIDVSLSAGFSNGNEKLEVPGFYDGNNQWKIRFMPTKTGTWNFETTSSLGALSGQKGAVTCTEAAEGVHGPVKVADTFHFAYADGTAYYPVGTTCYVWNLQGEKLETQTLETLKNSPFNKIRFCVFPKRYTFNYNEPESYPFPGEVKEKWNPENQDDYTPRYTDFWDYDYFNPEYFQHLDDCVLKLMELGIEADLILFHPYDFGAWGFDTMPEEVNMRLLNYLVARLGAFRNIWWSFANEFDLCRGKTEDEWDRYIQLVQKVDPYDHLRSIHNCREFFDHKKPWLTHCSIQYKDWAKDLPLWFEEYQKPVVIDECGYEGNIDRDWGNISGKVMVRRFWEGFAGAAYVGHGETFVHPEDTLWWSKGGALHGESSARIAFMRDIIEEFPTGGLKKFEKKQPDSFMPDIGSAMGYGNFPEYGLFYFGVHQPSFRLLELPEDGSWQIDVIDTWEMTIEPLGSDFKGKCRVELPAKEFMAIRVKRTS